MKDVIIATIVLVILVVIFSCCGTTTTMQGSQPAESHGEGSKEQGESSIVLPGEGDIPESSPKTGYKFYFF